MDRRLAAILAADVVGYCRLMGEDEVGTHTAIEAHYREVVEPAVSRHHGTIIGTRGDGILTDFPSVVHAIESAVAIQTAMASRNRSARKDRQVEFRIGINLGDIASRNGDIFGDGVNIAFRLESLADPGGILVSETVREHVGTKLDVEFESLGSKTLKNIRHPVSIHRLVWNRSGGAEAAAPPNMQRRALHRASIVSRRLASKPGRAWRTGLVLVAVLGIAFAAVFWKVQQIFNADRDQGASALSSVPAEPSIAVLPFSSLGGGEAVDTFSDGMTNDIITDLSKFSGLFVIAANSTFRYKNRPTRPKVIGDELGVRYMLEGSVQYDGGRLRINAQLIETETEHHLWADRYDRDMADLFSVQNEISRKIIGVIGPAGTGQGKLRQTELARLAKTPTDSLQAYHHYLRGLVHLERFDRVENRLAREAFEAALARDPRYSKALAKIAWTHVFDYWNDWTGDLQSALGAAEDAAERAVSADQNEPDSHQALAATRLFQRRHEQANVSLKKAVELNPNGADMLIWAGWALTYMGQAEEGLKLMEKAVERNPFHPGWYLWDLAWAKFVLREYQDAADILERRTPRTGYTHLLLAILYSKLGREKEWQAEMADFRAAEPGFSIETAERVEPFMHDKDLEHYLDALRAVGLPERG